MEDRIYLIVRLRVKTTHKGIEKAIDEVEKNTKLEIPSTPNVEVLSAHVLRTQRKFI